MPDPGCSNGTYRPWALGIRNGVLYAGAICDGSAAAPNAPNAPNIADESTRAFLQGFVYRLDAGTFTQVLNFPLDYDREPPFGYSSGTCTSGIDGWYGWVDNLPATCENGIISYPQPILTDLEFDTDGNLILGFSDRTGFQIGFGNYGPTSNTLYSTYSAGDILFACNDGMDNWTIENPTSCTNANGGAIGGTNNTYPSFIFDGGYPNYGEYFVGDFFSDGGSLIAPPWFPGHAEIAIGALAISGNEVVSTSYDPVTAEGGLFNRGGVIKLSTESGRRTVQGYELYNTDVVSGTAGKGSGLGDLELMCSPAPIEIGNYVWEDIDGDGIQDACEPGIDNINIRLFDENCTLIGLTTTSNGGQYYFNQTNVNTSLEANTTYYVVMGDDGDWNKSKSEIAANGFNYGLTNANQEDNDLIDSDGVVGTGCGFSDAPFISVTTTDAGVMNHSLDFGLLQKCNLNITYSQSNCTETSPGVFEATLDIAIAYANAPSPSQDIILSLDGLSQNISVSSNSTDTVEIQLTIPANGSNIELFAHFETETSCADTINILAPTPCVADVTLDCSNKISGTAFIDADFNGVTDNTGGLEGIKVYAYDCDNMLIDSTLTDSDGEYVLSVSYTHLTLPTKRIV